MNLSFDGEEYSLQKETYKIIGVAREVHRILGKGFSEIIYKDAIEYEFNTGGIFQKLKRILNTVQRKDIAS